MPKGNVFKFVVLGCFALAMLSSATCSRPQQRDQTTNAFPAGARMGDTQSCPDCRVWISPALEQGNIIRTDQTGHSIGFASEKSGINDSLKVTVGIEQWENGKKADHRHQIWRFECFSNNLTGYRAATCSVERLVIDDWGKMLPSPVVTTHMHRTSEKNLKMNRLDWEAGILDLTLTMDDGVPVEVDIRFKRMGNLYDLQSFKGVSVYRSSIDQVGLSTIEYRVPSYTYTLNVPLEMKGMSDAGLKRWDALFESLSDADKIAWKKLLSRQPEFSEEKAVQTFGQTLGQKVKQRLPGVNVDEVNEGTVKLSKSQEDVLNQIVKESMREQLLKLIEQSSLSPQAKGLIGAHIRSGLAEAR